MGAGRSADRARARRCGDRALFVGPGRDHRRRCSPCFGPATSCSCPTASTARRASSATTILKRFGVATRYYDPLIGSGIAELIGEQTRAILLESPGSLTMEVQDVPGICAVARERGIVTLLDNTWATPLFFPAIAAGVDITILAGDQICRRPCRRDARRGDRDRANIIERLEQTSWDLGHSVSPDDAWLGSRGLRTMAVRLKQHEESALKVAAMAEGAAAGRAGCFTRPCPIAPATNIGSAISRARPACSPSSSPESAMRRAAFVDRLELFGIGYSWGGYESLALPVDPCRTVTSRRRQSSSAAHRARGSGRPDRRPCVVAGPHRPMSRT